MSSKLEDFLMDEARNIKSEFAIVKKMVKNYNNAVSKLSSDLYDDIGKKTIGLSKAIEETELEDFKYSLKDWILKQYNDNDLADNIESIIDAIIDNQY